MGMFFFVKVWVVCLIWFVFCVVCLLKKWKYIIWVFLGNHGFSISISSSLFLFDFFFLTFQTPKLTEQNQTDRTKPKLTVVSLVQHSFLTNRCWFQVWQNRYPWFGVKTAFKTGKLEPITPLAWRWENHGFY